MPQNTWRSVWLIKIYKRHSAIEQNQFSASIQASNISFHFVIVLTKNKNHFKMVKINRYIASKQIIRKKNNYISINLHFRSMKFGATRKLLVWSFTRRECVCGWHILKHRIGYILFSALPGDEVYSNDENFYLWSVTACNSCFQMLQIPGFIQHFQLCARSMISTNFQLRFPICSAHFAKRHNSIWFYAFVSITAHRNVDWKRNHPAKFILTFRTAFYVSKLMQIFQLNCCIALKTDRVRGKRRKREREK